jgi:hypothetical protein
MADFWAGAMVSVQYILDDQGTGLESKRQRRGRERGSVGAVCMS